MNACHFIGNFTRDPELRFIQTKDVGVCEFTIAVNRKFKRGDEWVNEAAFLDMVAWDKGAEAIAKHFHKGDPIIVYCSVIQEKWEDKTTGNLRSKLKFRVNSFEFLPGARKNRDDEQEAGQEDNPKVPEPESSSRVADEDDDVPF